MSTTLRRYLVFETDCNNPGGGWNDFLCSFDQKENADSFALKMTNQYVSCHIVDTWHKDANKRYDALESVLKKSNNNSTPTTDDAVEFYNWIDNWDYES
jgi:hypothetical protein